MKTVVQICSNKQKHEVVGHLHQNHRYGNPTERLVKNDYLSKLRTRNGGAYTVHPSAPLRFHGRVRLVLRALWETKLGGPCTMLRGRNPAWVPKRSGGGRARIKRGGHSPPDLWAPRRQRTSSRSAWDRAQCAPRPVRRGRCFNGALMSRGKGSARSVVGGASLVLDHHHLSPLPLPPFPPPPTPPSEPLATPAPPVTASKRKHLEVIAQLGEPVIPVPKNLKRAKRDRYSLLIHLQREQVGAGRPQDRGTIIRCATPYLDIGLVFHYGSQARWVPPSPTDPTLSKDPAPAEGEEDIADNTLKTLVKGTLKLTYHKWPARFYADDSYKASDPRKGLSFAATSFCGPAYVDGAQLCVQRCHKSQACQQRSPGRRLSSPEMIVNVFSTHRTTSGTGADDASDDDDGDSDDEAIQAQRVARCGGVAAASRPRDNSRLLYYTLQWNYYASSLGGLVTLKLECMLPRTPIVLLYRSVGYYRASILDPTSHTFNALLSVSLRTVSLSCL
ncbi:hypothetical protein C8J57DRAFT_1231968 [Mycena rebaudengoi]|nr:hypothetical protein C8J57DRAFT_1231968 [Mycena rebaudengoi]